MEAGFTVKPSKPDHITFKNHFEFDIFAQKRRKRVFIIQNDDCRVVLTKNVSSLWLYGHKLLLKVDRL